MDATPAEITCLAQTIHGEARGESQKGQEAVGQVVINRTRSPKFPNTICAVVRQRHQFSGYKTHIIPSPNILALAKRLLSNQTINHIGEALYFNTVGPSHAIRVGNHKFWK
jgi:spore germination cell wall hydrolase CwlJ-like protein